MKANRSSRPLLVYDDVCGFCTWCVEFAIRRGTFEVVGFSELDDEDRARLPDDYETCTHLLTDEAVYSCGEAVQEVATRLETPARYPAIGFERLPGTERVREPLYRLVADNRDLFGRVLSRNPPAGTDS